MPTNNELEELLEEAKSKLKKYEEIIEQLKNTPLQLAMVIAHEKGKILLDTGGALKECDAPKTFKVKVGDQVLVHPMTGGLFEIATLAGNVAKGIASVKEQISEREFLVELEGGREAILTAACADIHTGDRVAIQGQLIVKALKRVGSSQFLQPYDGKVSWEDVKGQSEAVRLLREAIEWPKKHKELLKRFNRTPSKGLMLWGPPGCGKTLLAKAAVTALNGESKTPGFFYVKGPELLRSYVGQSEAEIRELFAQARAFQARTGEQPIIFVDEADAIVPRRGTGVSTDVMNTIVPQFLSEMDGLQEGGPFLLLATNLPGSLDPAVVRPGRIDNAIEVKRPDAAACQELFEHYLKDVPKSETSEDYSDYATARIFQRQDLELEGAPLREKLSGALVAGVCKEATSIAIRRNIEQPKTKDKGLIRSDLASALVAVCQTRKFDAAKAEEKRSSAPSSGWSTDSRTADAAAARRRWLDGDDY